MIKNASLHEILEKLIGFPSITPRDAGCQTFLFNHLSALGFECQRLDHAPVSNLYAQWGQARPLLLFAGHTDVVPVGDRSQWLSDPFHLTERDGFYYGRGVADMKGSLACMLLAVQRFIEQNPQAIGSLGFLITSGEEGDEYTKGTPYVMEQLTQQGIKVDYCLVGEPSADHRVGDTIKVGRRGSLTAKISLQGKQGHVAYPHLAVNPIHQIAPVLHELATTVWDEGNEYFPPTSLQITHIQAGGEATNIIPSEVQVHLNVRYCTEQTHDTLQSKITNAFSAHGLTPSIQWQHSGQPFLTSQGRLLTKCIETISTLTQQTPKLSTSGGTSDARFISPYGVEIVELGPVNKTIHQVNECVLIDDLHQLALIYERLCGLLSQSPSTEP